MNIKKLYSRHINNISAAAIIIFSLFLFPSCKKTAEPFVPVLTTSDVSLITTSVATSGGNIISNGDNIIIRGLCWNTNANPTISDSKTSIYFGDNNFSCAMTKLNVNTTYYVRAYATTHSGTSYGNELYFTLNLGMAGPQVVDIEGNNYNSVIISDQVWMSENLKTNKYNNGDLINTTNPPNLNISSESTPNYQWSYEGNENNVASYGRLYTWFAVTDSRKLCPIGWHISTMAEWSKLISYLGGTDSAGIKLREISRQYWLTENGSSNASGFSARGGGWRIQNEFNSLREYGLWWTTTDAIYMAGYPNPYPYSKKFGMSVRCVKD